MSEVSQFSQFLSALNGNQFTLQQRIAVWDKAHIAPSQNPNVLRKDSCGAWIKWADYGNTKSQWGWEIDHIYPRSLGGGDELNNLQPLHWQNNRAKGDSIAGFVCRIKAVQP